MSKSPNSVVFQPYVCPDCGNDVGFRSRPRSVIEQYILPVLLLRPVRCAHCFRRDYRLIFTEVRERFSDVPQKDFLQKPIVEAMPPAKAGAVMPSNRNVA
jgi:hypothetical protein